jgi:hypothetical protein
MTRFGPFLAFAGPMLCALIAAGCVRPEPESHASAVERAACRHRADQVYAMQNPDEVYRSDTFATSTRDAPFAGSGVPVLPNRGLSSGHTRDQMVADCLDSSAGNVGSTPAAPAPDATPPP